MNARVYVEEPKCDACESVVDCCYYCGCEFEDEQGIICNDGCEHYCDEDCEKKQAEEDSND